MPENLQRRLHVGNPQKHVYIHYLMSYKQLLLLTLVLLQEAVAIQLEEERLVKIRDVLTELPAPHYRYSRSSASHLCNL